MAAIEYSEFRLFVYYAVRVAGLIIRLPNGFMSRRDDALACSLQQSGRKDT